MDAPLVKNEPNDTVSVELPRRHRTFAFALVWLVFVIFERIWGWNHGLSHHQAADYILSRGGLILLGLISCWRALARYWIRVSPRELTLDITALGLHQTRHFALSEVANL